MVSRSVFVVLAYYSSGYEQSHDGLPLYESHWLSAMAGMKHHQSSPTFRLAEFFQHGIFFDLPLTNTPLVQYLRPASARLRQRFHGYLQLLRYRADCDP